MEVFGRSGQGCFDVIYNIGALTNLLTSKAILVLPSTGLPNYEQFFVIEIVRTIRLVCFGFLMPLALVYIRVAFKMRENICTNICTTIS